MAYRFEYLRLEVKSCFYSTEVPEGELLRSELVDLTGREV